MPDHDLLQLVQQKLPNIYTRGTGKFVKHFTIITQANINMYIESVRVVIV